MRFKKLICLLLFLTLLTSCGGNAENDRIEPKPSADTSQATEKTETDKTETDKAEQEKEKAEAEKAEAEKSGPDKADTGKTEPKNSSEMFDFVMDKWKTGDTEALYPYISDEMMSLCDSDTVVRMFESITDTFGEIVSNDEPERIAVNGIDVYSTTVHLENADADISLSLKDAKIYGFSRDIRFTGEFDVIHGTIREHYFLLNGLNAVYTCSESSESSPVMLMISGSGPSDYNETVGLLSPMEDLALGLAEHGISTLRLEKRTLRFPNDFSATDGIEEEYLKDCRAALSYLKELDNTGGVYLLGHSLGGQIAAALALEDDSIAGMVLLMSSARHLADICYDQYAAADPLRTEEYARYRDAAKNQSGDNTSGQYFYFGASDAYWASYNTLNTIESIRFAAIPAAIINSTGDNQIFNADISLWTESFAGDENVTLTVFEDMSHFGYKIDTRDPVQLYKEAEMPDELIDSIVQAVF